jgi:peptidyl-prolyl cis-trans isomerase SurA
MEFIRYLALAGMCLAVPVMAQEKPAGQEQPKMEKPQMAPEAEADKGADKSKTADKDKAKTTAAKPRTASSEGKVVEEIIARVNNEIITRSELDKGRRAAEEEATQECSGRCTPEQLQVAIEDRKKNALRDLIDQSLLVQRGKDMGISVESDVIKKLDAIRTQNNMASMEELEKGVTSQGMNWEDFKSNIRNSSLTQAVIGREVGSHLSIGRDEVEKYYNEHKSEFMRPEQVALRSLEVNTQGKKEEEIPELKKKAETALKRIQDGEDFGEIAKRFSDGSTAKQGGYLGVYKRGELAKELETKVFAMKKNELTEIMDTKQGFLIMQVLEHYDEGEQPLAKVETEIMDKLYGQRMEPAYREYLKTLREQSYVVIKPGYQDIAGGGNSEIQEVSATPEVTKDRKPRKKYILFGKKS